MKEKICVKCFSIVEMTKRSYYVGVLKLNYQESKQGADIKASNFLMKTYL